MLASRAAASPPRVGPPDTINPVTPTAMYRRNVTPAILAFVVRVLPAAFRYSGVLTSIGLAGSATHSWSDAV
jgi:hypothetical protein